MTDSIRKPPDPGPPKAERPFIGDVNVLEASVGAKGTGKTTWNCIRADELVRQWGGAYVIGHSMGTRLPSRLPDGYELPIVYYQTLDKLQNGLRKHPQKWHILAPSLELEDAETADDFLRFAVQLSAAIKKDAWIKTHPFKSLGGLAYDPNKATFDDVRAIPVIVIVDEGSAVKGAGRTKSNQNLWFLQFLISLRHLHIALLWSFQDPTMRSWHVLGEATDIHVFSLRHEYALQSIRAAGATEAELEMISNLPTGKELRDKVRTHEPPVTLALTGNRSKAPIDIDE